MKKYLFILISFLFLNSCSVHTPLFIQNFTNDEVELKIISNHYLISQFSKIFYAEGIIRPGQFYNNSTQKYEITEVEFDHLTVSMILPGNSTVLLHQGVNENYKKSIRQVLVNGKEINKKEFLSSLKKKGKSSIFKIK